ncbi:MAG: DUF1573 domain-containing protein, partial [Acidobacteriales bacterium]|nr:DUF1573 domain-containing protein [Terriglobales bacterium]
GAVALAQTKDSSAATDVVRPPETAGPKIQFASTTFNFGTIESGAIVKHDFVFTNSGTAILEIKDVRPGCGCTATGKWDRLVEPGKTGVIPLEFNSANFGGTINKSAAVTCNDPAQTNVLLQITGIVWKAIEVTPMMAYFHLSSEGQQTNETRIVRIVNNQDEPLTLSDLQCTNKSFKAELKTVKPGKEFEVHITAIPPFASLSISAPVTLKTSSPKMPSINLSAYVMVQEPVAVSPNSIVLPAGALTNATRRDVIIRNNGTNTLVLSDAKVNVPGGEVRLAESLPGRMFSLAVTLPTGFEMKPGQAVEVTVKSNHPRYPLIKVPVIQPMSVAAPKVLTPIPAVPTPPAAPLTGGK